MFEVPQGTKVKTGYYLKIPNVYVFLQEITVLGLIFRNYRDAQVLIVEKEESIRIAKKYGLEAIERKITTTTQIEEISIYKEEIK